MHNVFWLTTDMVAGVVLLLMLRFFWVVVEQPVLKGVILAALFLLWLGMVYSATSHLGGLIEGTAGPRFEYPSSMPLLTVIVAAQMALGYITWKVRWNLQQLTGW